MTNCLSFRHRTIIGQSSSGRRAIIIYRSLTVRTSTIDRSSYDALRWHKGYVWTIFKFCKHMSASHRPMIGRGPLADQKLFRSPNSLSIFIDAPTSQKFSDVKTVYGGRGIMRYTASEMVRNLVKDIVYILRILYYSEIARD